MAFDYCSYRLPCKTVMGDRSYKLTRKRFESKKAMLDVYKEASMMTQKLEDKSKSKEEKAKDGEGDDKSSTIFDFGKIEDGEGQIGLESSVLKLQKAIKKVKQADGKETD
jgi:hypothetical protein